MWLLFSYDRMNTAMIRKQYPYGSLWISPTSIADFDKCPRLYFLHNVYKNPKTGKKIQVTNPHMTLGLTVHNVLGTISKLPKNKRFEIPLATIFENEWSQYLGKRGGFRDTEEEAEFKQKGIDMLLRLEKNPGILTHFANKISEKIPSMLLSQKDNIILCGVVDWIEVLLDGSLHIIDFKTGKKNDEESSLQLAVYMLLVAAYLKRSVSKMSYWYLAHDDGLVEAEIPDVESVTKFLIEKGQRIKEAKSQAKLSCTKGGCRYCEKFEKVTHGEGEYVGPSSHDRELYFVTND